MRVNVYTEELHPNEQPRCEIVTAEYVSVKTGKPMKNYGLRVYLKSHPDLHYVPPRDDDRSAVTFWCGSSFANVLNFIDELHDVAAIFNEAREAAPSEGEP